MAGDAREYRSSPLKFCALTVAVLAISACAGGKGTVLDPPASLDAAGGAPKAAGSHVHPIPLATIAVDIRPYMAARIGGSLQYPGQMLCTEIHENICVTSTNDGNSGGEVKIMYDKSSNIVDYIAITSWKHKEPNNDAPYYIGVIRNFSGNGGFLRCFSTYDQYGAHQCSAPPNSFFVPEGVPYLMNDVPIVGYDVVQDASNPDGSPRVPIPGALLVTNTQSGYDQFAVMAMDAGCAQTPKYGGPSASKVLIAYVRNVPFGGSAKYGIQTRDAIVIDTFGQGPPKTAERYFYVAGLGRVEEGHSTYDYAHNDYDLNTLNTVHNDLKPLDTSIINFSQTAKCGQGSYIPLWGSLFR